MKAPKTLILTDNPYACDIAYKLDELYGGIDICQSQNGSLTGVTQLNIRRQASKIVSKYELILSMHYKQLIPKYIIDEVRCINVHPGLNPYNRGWFPQVFSIINGLPFGVTIHEIDVKIDHGPIIIQKEYDIKPWDTSGSIYAKTIAIERELVLQNFISIRDQTYEAYLPREEGNINYKKDYEKLKKIDLEQKGTFGEFINILRALSHDDFKNAYFIDKEGKKIFVKIDLELDRCI